MATPPGMDGLQDHHGGREAHRLSTALTLTWHISLSTTVPWPRLVTWPHPTVREAGAFSGGCGGEWAPACRCFCGIYLLPPRALKGCGRCEPRGLLACLYIFPAWYSGLLPPLWRWILYRRETRKFSREQGSRCLLNPMPSGSGSCETTWSFCAFRRENAGTLTCERHCCVFIAQEAGERIGLEKEQGRSRKGSGSGDGGFQLPSLHSWVQTLQQRAILFLLRHSASFKIIYSPQPSLLCDITICH